jgi:branched-chain amino acid transport system ATP-binding protein
VASVTQLRPAFAPAPAAARGPGPVRAPLASNDALVLTEVTREFGALRAVDGVSLTVAAGQKYAVLGSNGAGKTTLFNTITGDFPPTRGQIRFFGEDITALPPAERTRKGLRRTYQSSMLFRELSVRDNLFLAVRGVASGRYSFLRPHAGHPSRVATNELLELFDEPAAGLSPAERRELVQLLKSLPAHIGYVLIEHDLEIALRVVEQVTVMHNGRVLVSGTPEQIENDAQVQAIYMGGHH